MHHIAHLLVYDSGANVSHDVVDQFVEDAYSQEAAIAQVQTKSTFSKVMNKKVHVVPKFQAMIDMRRRGNYYRSTYANVGTLRANFSQVNFFYIH